MWRPVSYIIQLTSHLKYLCAKKKKKKILPVVDNPHRTLPKAHRVSEFNFA